MTTLPTGQFIHTVRDMAMAQLGIAPEAFTLREATGRFSTHPADAADRRKLIQFLRETGLSYKAIAETLPVTTTQINSAIHDESKRKRARVRSAEVART